MNKSNWFARLFVLAVIGANLQSAFVLILKPQTYAPSFELTGAPGVALIRGLGFLFVMWNVPYVIAAWNPNRHRLAIYESLAMQTIGLAGEIWIHYGLPIVHTTARASILRFIIFDALGLIALVVAAWISRPNSA